MFYNNVSMISSEIPKRIREKVLILWLQGICRDETAKITGIRAGSVSVIMKAYKSNDSDIDLEREYVVYVRKQGYDIRRLESSIRRRNREEKLNWKEEQVETLFDMIEEHRFEKRKEIEVFIKEFEEFLKNRPVFRRLQRTERALTRFTREKNDSVAYINRINKRLDDFVLLPNTREMISKIGNEIIESVLKEFQIGTTNNQMLNVEPGRSEELYTGPNYRIIIH
jgi:hypothetical protein